LAARQSFSYDFTCLRAANSANSKERLQIIEPVSGIFPTFFQHFSNISAALSSLGRRLGPEKRPKAVKGSQKWLKVTKNGQKR